MEAYFDNSATTRCFDEVKDIVCKTMTGDFGNPSAMHKKGMEAENYVRRSAQTLAKLLKVNEKAFREFLNKEKIMYKLGGDWVPYQNHIDAGRFEIKAGLAEHEESSHAFTQSKFTAKGVEWVAGEYAKSLVRDAVKV